MPEINFEKEENKRLLRNLYAYARGYYTKLYEDEPNWRGKGFEDYVHDAIVKHILDQDNYDAGKGPLEYHLKYHLIKQALTNDLPPAVKKAYAEYRIMTEEERAMSQQKTATEAAPIDPDELSIVSLVASNIDSAELLKELESEINGDTVIEQIYLAVVYDKYEFSERAEICRDFNISLHDFDNGKRRFMTILRRVFKKLDIKA